MATYYVSLTGNNAWNGLAPAFVSGTTGPKRNFANAVALLAAGDTLYIRGGVWTEQLDLMNPSTKTGTAGNILTIAGYPGETVIIRYTDTAAAGYGGVKSWNSSYMLYDNLDIDGINYPAFGGGGPNGTAQIGFHVVAGMHHSQFNNLRIYNQFFVGFIVEGGTFITISNCETYNARTDCLTGDRYYGIYLHHGDTIECRNNHIHNMPGGGIQVYGESGSLSNIVIKQNRIHDVSHTCTNSNVGGIIVSRLAQSLTGVQIYDNLIYNVGLAARTGGITDAAGIEVSKGVTNVSVWSNTLYNNGGTGIKVLDSTTTGCAVQNNIVYQSSMMYGSGNISIGGGVTLTNDHNFTTDPSFVNAGAFDLHLQSSSPAGNGGTPLAAVTLDYDNVVRGNPPDIGAYEIVSSDITPPSAPLNLRIV